MLQPPETKPSEAPRGPRSSNVSKSTLNIYMVSAQEKKKKKKK